MTARARFKQSDKIAFTVDEAASALGISRSSFYAQVRAGELETFKWCGRTLVRRDVLEAAIDRASGRAAA